MWRELPHDKPAARALIRAGRRARPPHERAGDDLALAGHLRDLLGGTPPGHVAAYDALPTEPPTRAMVELLGHTGWRVMMPILLPDNDLGWDDGNSHDPSYVSGASLLIVPALAVDRRGMRLGQGGGSYDRALHRRSPGALVLAVVYDDELADVVPSEPHDLAVDAVLTPRAGVRHLTE
ncbi:5-formyltetrahydrofolate cyclo-ligase [Allobranchiibius sp. CTAmp26]|uniref:5-formyltetrahydrofolate cyclo-ligase n=1 Tax=Allobranchiibius sp. CTAmp26 TaxID=2815214 RepID=UPI001AA0BD00|nr:5-formyltetrahydrofolate cyclo-ligase [Allobranchiibius sp. CTAmp26]MBO1753533.1 ligase [Allobranchiibius sp. CTAmp26]